MSKAFRATGAAIAGIALGLVGITVFAGAASATDSTVPPAPMFVESNTCKTIVNHGNLDNVNSVGTPTKTLTINGVEVVTPANPDKVTWKTDLTPHVALNNVQNMSYQTYKFANGVDGEFAVPAYHVYLALPGNKTATLVYEPYWSNTTSGLLKPDTGVWHTWNAKVGKWWTSSNDVNGMTAEGGGGEHNKTWTEIANANPTAEITGFGWGQGTYNKGAHTILNSIKFSASENVCLAHNWSTKYAVPSTTPSAVPTASAAPSTIAVVPVAQPSLPITGVSVPAIVTTGIIVLAIGGFAIFFTRRRKTN